MPSLVEPKKLVAGMVLRGGELADVDWVIEGGVGRGPSMRWVYEDGEIVGAELVGTEEGQNAVEEG